MAFRFTSCLKSSLGIPDLEQIGGSYQEISTCIEPKDIT